MPDVETARGLISSWLAIRGMPHQRECVCSLCERSEEFIGRTATPDRLADNEALVDRLCASGLHPDDVIRTSSVLMRGRRQGVLAMLRLVDEHLGRR